MSYADQKALDDAYVMHTFARFPVEFVSGRGMVLVDSEGKQYLDFLAGIGVVSLGHGHPVVVSAIQSQAAKLIHASNYFQIEHRGEVAERLSDLANDGVDYRDAPTWMTFFANSGAEANECAMKLARLRAKRGGSDANVIVCLNGSFHGRTLETVAATMQDRLQNDFQPLPGGFLATDPNDVDALERLFSEHANEICAVMLEPIQGESGVHPLTQEFMEAIRRLCDENGALMIADEVQTGIFRSGRPFAFQLYGVTPDIFTLAKGIAGGMPMGACVAREDIAKTFRPSDHGSTFGGSNLAVATADAVLEELVEGGYADRAREVGAYLMERLAEVPHVKDVRGAGLMVGCDLDESAPDAHDVVSEALRQGFVLNATGPSTLRLLPPLICEKKHVDALVRALPGIIG